MVETVRNWTDLISLLILLFLLGWPLQKSITLCHFKSNLNEIQQKCSSRKYTSIDWVGFSIWCHTFKMAAMTSFHTEKCYHLVTAHAASALCICSSIWQFPIHSAFILVVIFSCLYHEVEVINMVYCGDCRLIYIRDVHALNYFCLSDAICVKDTGSVSGTARETHGRERNIANILASCSGYEAHSSA